MATASTIIDALVGLVIDKEKVAVTLHTDKTIFYWSVLEYFIDCCIGALDTLLKNVVLRCRGLCCAPLADKCWLTVFLSVDFDRCAYDCEQSTAWYLTDEL